PRCRDRRADHSRGAPRSRPDQGPRSVHGADARQPDARKLLLAGTAVRWAVLDTNVYIDFWERGLHAHAVQTIHGAFVVRHAAVVLSELRRGARTQQARRTVESLYRLASEV